MSILRQLGTTKPPAISHAGVGQDESALADAANEGALVAKYDQLGLPGTEDSSGQVKCGIISGSDMANQKSPDMRSYSKKKMWMYSGMLNQGYIRGRG